MDSTNYIQLLDTFNGKVIENNKDLYYMIVETINNKKFIKFRKNNTTLYSKLIETGYVFGYNIYINN